MNTIVKWLLIAVLLVGCGSTLSKQELVNNVIQYVDSEHNNICYIYTSLSNASVAISCLPLS